MPLLPARHPRVSPLARQAANPVGIIRQSALCRLCRERHKRHPGDMGMAEITRFLEHLAQSEAREGRVASLCSPGASGGPGPPTRQAPTTSRPRPQCRIGSCGAGLRWLASTRFAKGERAGGRCGEHGAARRRSCTTALLNHVTKRDYPRPSAASLLANYFGKLIATDIQRHRTTASGTKKRVCHSPKFGKVAGEWQAAARCRPRRNAGR